MAQVIVIEDNKTMLDLLTLNLKTYANAEVIPRESASEALDLLKILPSIDLIITKAHIEAEDCASDIADFLIDNSLEIPVVVVGTIKEEYPGIEQMASFVEDEKDWEGILKKSAEILGVSEDSLSKRMNPDYVPIPVKYFTVLESSFCDIFIRIKKGPGEYQFVKRIHQGEDGLKEVVQKYIGQGLKNFYIPKEFEDNFTNYLSNQLVSKLENNELPIEEKIEAMSQGYNMATSEIYKLGFTSATIQLAESIVDSMINTFKAHPEMSPLLYKVINSKTGYMYRHAHMCSIVCSEILKNLDLDKQDLHEKLAYASFFKDIALTENEELAKISSYEELENANLSDSEWDLVFNHAGEGAMIIRKHPEAPLDIDTIIKNHHGTTNGKGYSVTNNAKFPMLSMIFIVAVEFTNELLSFRDSGRKPRPIMDILKEKYDAKAMKDIVKALEKTIKSS